MSMAELIQCLETIVGSHGVGRIDLVEPRAAGGTTRTIVEAPAAVALDTAHRELQNFVVSADLVRIGTTLGAEYADLIASGQWFGPTRGALDGFVEKVQQHVSGVVRLKIFKGDCRVVGRKGPGVGPGSDRSQTTSTPVDFRRTDSVAGSKSR
jgi:argininosuccinate synthase